MAEILVQSVKARHLQVGDKLVNSYLGVKWLREIVEVVKESKNNAGVYVAVRKDKQQWVGVKFADGKRLDFLGNQEVQIQQREGGK